MCVCAWEEEEDGKGAGEGCERERDERETPPPSLPPSHCTTRLSFQFLYTDSYVATSTRVYCDDYGRMVLIRRNEETSQRRRIAIRLLAVINTYHEY